MPVALHRDPARTAVTAGAAAALGAALLLTATPAAAVGPATGLASARAVVLTSVQAVASPASKDKGGSTSAQAPTASAPTTAPTQPAPTKKAPTKGAPKQPAPPASAPTTAPTTPVQPTTAPTTTAGPKKQAPTKKAPTKTPVAATPPTQVPPKRAPKAGPSLAPGRAGPGRTYGPFKDAAGRARTPAARPVVVVPAVARPVPRRVGPPTGLDAPRPVALAGPGRVLTGVLGPAAASLGPAPSAGTVVQRAVPSVRAEEPLLPPEVAEAVEQLARQAVLPLGLLLLILLFVALQSLVDRRDPKLLAVGRQRDDEQLVFRPRPA